MPLRAVAVAALLPLLTGAAAAAADGAPAVERWRRPVGGAVVRDFALGPHPFAPGQHRGVDLAVRRGEAVRAACGGRVRFAGWLPGRGRGVSVACGRLVATHLGLGRVAVRRGAVVAAGMVVGTARGGHVQLGARRRGERHGYVDPLTLLAAHPPPPPPLGPAPPPRGRARPAAPRAVPVPRPPPVPATRPAPAPAPAPGPQGVPLAAWLGLALLTAGLPLGGLARRRRRHGIPSHSPARRARAEA